MLQSAANNISATELQNLYAQLLDLKNKADKEGVVAPGRFAILQQQTENLQTPVTAHRLIYLHNQLQQFMQYMQQFDRYKKAVSVFFANHKSNNNFTYEQLLRYFFIQNLSRRLFDDFCAGNYLETHIEPSINLLLNLIAGYVKCESRLMQHPPTPADIEKLPVFNVLKQPTGNLPLKEYVKRFFPNETAFTFSSKRLGSIAGGFFMLSAYELKDTFLGKPNPFTPLLAQLKEALLTHNHAQVSHVLNKMTQLIPPVIINTPGNNSTTRFKVIDIQGTAPPNSGVILILNNNTQFTTQANEQGFFTFAKTELQSGQNTLQCYSPQYQFLYPSVPVYCITFVAAFPFTGRIDPVTQQPLTETEIESIWRCANCKNYMFSYSVEDNNGVCVILKCNGKTFYNHRQKEFWTQ
ncbi:hypothetical protein C7N43_19540 [Sphingobacteriales bacterium UPWRP_1]|nr:hypothetical protein B6N25_02035 [Sphingobacteriales bacterium TSM_CSS]PSJ75336.1 hypothetical protein C7N43_19540 [Sphingobacteriales bacterium UPWRP_1]